MSIRTLSTIRIIIPTLSLFSLFLDPSYFSFFFFLSDPPPPEIYPFPLHAALPIGGMQRPPPVARRLGEQVLGHEQGAKQLAAVGPRRQRAVQLRRGGGGDGGLNGGPAVAGDP